MSRVLIVEDDPSVTALLRVMLHLLGHDVASAVDAEGALALAQNADLILMDNLFGEDVSGVALLTWLRARAGWAVPAIFVTGDYSAVVAAGAELAGAAVVYKPFDVETLAAAVEAVLDR